MAKNRTRISDGTSVEEVQALLLNCVRRLRALTPPVRTSSSQTAWKPELAGRTSSGTGLRRILISVAQLFGDRINLIEIAANRSRASVYRLM